MLTHTPAASSAPLDLHSSPRSVHVSVPGRALQPQVSIPDNGYASPRQQQLDRRTPAPASPGPHQPQHGLNAPRPSLSPLSEYHSGFADEDLGSPRPPPSPSPSPFSVGNHRRQQSFPNLLPLPFGSRTPSPTRKTHARSPSEQMPYTGEGRRRAADSPRGGGLVGWLSGSAGAASALGISPGGSANGTSIQDAPAPAPAAAPDTTPTRQSQPPAGHARTASDATTPKNTMTTASRFMSALSSRFSNPTTSTPTSPSLPSPAHDELYNLNIETALFPRSPDNNNPSSPLGSSSNNSGPFSPAAYKNLQMNALGLLTKMQTAYREQATALRDLQAERSAQGDELEEAVTRAQHLKMQLEGMARTAQEQEGAMKTLAGQLAAERRARARVEAEAAAAVTTSGRAPSEGAASMVSEDLGVDEDRRRMTRMTRTTRRPSRPRKSWKSGEDGGGEEEETDEDESVESESVFSRCRSPALPAQAHLVSESASSSSSSVVVGGEGAGRNTHTNPAGAGSVNATPKQKGGQQMNAFQKILKGIAGEEAGCRNCKGQDASVAWDTVGLLRDENRHLKTRVGELEVAVEGALDLVNGLGL